jgi:hypothetical protein
MEAVRKSTNCLEVESASLAIFQGLGFDFLRIDVASSSDIEAVQFHHIPDRRNLPLYILHLSLDYILHPCYKIRILAL